MAVDLEAFKHLLRYGIFPKREAFVSVSKLREMARDAVAELEQLRASNEQLREGIRNREADELAALHDIDNLRAAARALRDSLPKCYQSANCGKPATRELDIDVYAFCEEHGSDIEKLTPWAAALRALEKELGDAG